MDPQDLPLSGLKLLRPRLFGDARGFFLETYHEPRYRAMGIDCGFAQDNHSHSIQGTLRGLHYQSAPGQAKLIRVVRGRIFDVAVDIRPGSPTFGRWHGLYLDAEEHIQLFIPVGFAHGFCVVSESADVLYKTSSVYDASAERTLAWNDREIGVDWPTTEPLLSDRDRAGESFATFRRRLSEGEP
jgi:dTDP-4-dehydrorhamnose 3,5-epimerase